MQSKSANNIKGIDISHHNTITNWKKVKDFGVQFAFIKSTEGITYVDSDLDSNVKGAKSVGIKVGFYHYAHAERNNPVEEANFFVSKVKGYELDLAYVLDLEGDSGNIGATKVTQWAKTFMDTVKKATGKTVMLYTGASFARSYCGSILAEYPLWVAHYGTDTPMGNNTWSTWSAFQYTSSGKVDGISGNVDVNVMEKAFFDKLTTKPAPTQEPQPSPQPTATDNVKVVVNDKLVAYGRIIDGHVYLPLRKLGEALGKDVSWDNDKKVPYVGGEAVDQFKLIDGSSFVQVRKAAELLGGIVSWDNSTKKVYIYK